MINPVFQKNIDWAEKEVLRAREATMTKTKEAFDADQVEERFEAGETVRLYKDVPARRDPQTGELLQSNKESGGNLLV